ncbi:hypothetical protein LAZ29_15825 [Cereibacter sphaeroides]|uniref:hypothetical protein n=1 Tax=Cereibacter sphaeroides TaxID=1063 RepID=UPI001F1DD219|nr:hypothetical protein [Cereibacter sphaeroides]MCE6952403.1 hypothetical protein [Cereibacter sphaeroides]
MAAIDDKLEQALRGVGVKPDASASATEKKAYSEAISHRVAHAVAAEFRERGLTGTRPAPPGEFDSSGAERRMAGGIGAKKVDVTWATEESGLLLGISIKTINFRDRKTGNFQKNLTNRRGDMLFEGVTLHRRFPYAVLGGLLFLDRGAASDGTAKRRSTFLNAHSRFRLFTGRDDPAGREEQYERLYILLLEASPGAASVEAYRVGNPADIVPMEEVIAELVDLVALRNPDFYESDGGVLSTATG